MRIALVALLAAAPAFAQESGTLSAPWLDTPATNMQRFVLTPTLQPQGSVIISGGGAEVLRIDPKGVIFWKGREVKGDREFRRAMLDVRQALTQGCRRP